MDKNIFIKQFNLFNKIECPDYIFKERIMIYDNIEMIDLTISVEPVTFSLSEISWVYNENNYRIPYYKDLKQGLIRLNESNNIYDFISSSSILPINELISGERISSICDIYLGTSSGISSNPNISKFISNIQLIDKSPSIDEVKKIFIKSEDLPIIYKKYNLKEKIIVSHNSDHGVNSSMISNLENVNKQFSQNCYIFHPNLYPLPIGIENSQWFDYNILERVRTNNEIIKDKEIYFFFNYKTHISRKQCIFYLQNKLKWNKSLKKEDYFIELKRHKYAICPRGNGLDTHRLWECLYLDVIPIMIKTDDIKIKNLPIIFLDDWRQLNPLILTKKFKNIEMKKITLSYYKELIST